MVPPGLLTEVVTAVAVLSMPGLIKPQPGHFIYYRLLLSLLEARLLGRFMVGTSGINGPGHRLRAWRGRTKGSHRGRHYGFRRVGPLQVESHISENGNADVSGWAARK
jgi:hypothetical protein